MFGSEKRRAAAVRRFLPASSQGTGKPVGPFALHAVFADTHTHAVGGRYGEFCESKRRQAAVWGWKGESAAAQIVILSAAQPLHNVRVMVGELRCGDFVLPVDAVIVSFLKEVNAFIGHAGWYARNPKGILPRGPKTRVPDVVYGGESAELEPYSLKQVWVEVKLPKNQPAGMYEGTLTVCADNTGETAELSLCVEVLNAVMPPPEEYTFTVEYWQHPYNIAEYYGVNPFSREHLAILRGHMELYKSLGGKVVTASIVEEAWGGQTYSKNPVRYPSMIRWRKRADGTVTFDFTQFDAWVGLCKELGIGENIVCYSLLPWNNIVTYVDEADGCVKQLRVKSQDAQAYQAVWLPFLKAFAAHLDEKGWFSSIYLGFDERRNMDIAFDTIDMVQNKEGKTFKKSAAFNDFLHNRAIFDRLNRASVGLDEVRSHEGEFRALIKERKEAAPRKETTLYTATDHYPNSFSMSMPCESYWSVFYAAKMGADGFLRWALDAWVEHPLEDATHWSFQAGDCFLVYPDERESREKASKYSVRLKKLDEAVRDINKLRLIVEECPELAPQAEALLQSVKQNYTSFTQYHPFWGPAIRRGTWADAEARQTLPVDMEALKAGVKALSKAYIQRRNGEEQRTEEIR